MIPKISFHIFQRVTCVNLRQVKNLNSELFGLKLFVSMLHGVISDVKWKADPAHEKAKHYKLVNHYNLYGKVLLSNWSGFEAVDAPCDSVHVKGILLNLVYVVQNLFVTLGKLAYFLLASLRPNHIRKMEITFSFVNTPRQFELIFQNCFETFIFKAAFFIKSFQRDQLVFITWNWADIEINVFI